MDYTIETAFCNNETRQFIFENEERLRNFLLNSQEQKILIENINSYQRMLIHLITDHYQMISKSCEERGPKEKNYEENKQGDQLRNVEVLRTKDSKCPLLTLRDYLS
mmetsp:Transcript_37408/g.33535  ORF Transcript_37408/g.33535 Transcript_37408/m.33535 type:complete len:107 (-) Transcript_37408:1894-2214(-)